MVDFKRDRGAWLEYLRKHPGIKGTQSSSHRDRQYWFNKKDILCAQTGDNEITSNGQTLRNILRNVANSYKANIRKVEW